MKFLYAPPPGSIVICNYRNTINPEMDKLRPAVILSSVSPRLAIVVPLSTTTPKPPQPWHYLVRLSEPITDYFSTLECWAKCDMIAAVSFERLSLPMVGWENGRRKYKVITLPVEDLAAIRSCAWSAISH